MRSRNHAENQKLDIWARGRKGKDGKRRKVDRFVVVLGKETRDMILNLLARETWNIFRDCLKQQRAEYRYMGSS